MASVAALSQQATRDNSRLCLAVPVQRMGSTEEQNRRIKERIGAAVIKPVGTTGKQVEIIAMDAG